MPSIRCHRTARLAATVVLALATSQFEAIAQEVTAPALVATTEHRTPEEERRGFRLPPGFEAQLVAAEPQIAKPMNLAFDDRGRLWATVSLEYPYPAEGDSRPRDSVVILSDFAADGHAQSIQTYADGLNIPIGVLPIGDGDEALVYSIPDIWRLHDDDGDGRADRREPALGTFGSRDTHGMTNAFTLGFDGWVHACHGFSNTSEVAAEDGSALSMTSGNTYRFLPDGSRIEPWSHGQVNPFGLAFDGLGNLYSCDCHSRPIYQLLRGAYYPSFGRPDDGLGFGPEVMTHDHGSTGISGIAILDSDSFPEDLCDDVLIGNVVTSRINRDRLDWRGSTPVAVAEPDFLVSEDPWFRPVDIELGPDGALYVADFYNRIIGHYEVPLTHPGRDRSSGRIWRIVYRGDDAEATPPPGGGDFTAAPVAGLASALGHPNISVRMRAMNRLASLGEASRCPVSDRLSDTRDAATWSHGLWALERTGGIAPEMFAEALRHPDRAVRTHAMRLIGETSDMSMSDRVAAEHGLIDEEPVVRRSAADALGRHPDRVSLRPLLDARRAADPADTHLVYVLRMAIRDTMAADPDASWPNIHDPDYDAADRAVLADIAPGVAALPSVRFLLDYLATNPEAITSADVQRFAEHIARRGDAETDEAGLTVVLTQSSSLNDQAERLQSLHRGWQARGAGPSPRAISTAERIGNNLLDSRDPAQFRRGAELAGEFRLTSAIEVLAEAATRSDRDESTREQALNSIVVIDPAAAVEPLAKVLADGSAPARLRERSARLLGEVGRPEAVAPLRDALVSAPSNLQSAIAEGLAATRPGASALLDDLEAGKADPRLARSPAVAARLGGHGIPDLAGRVEALVRDLPPPDEAARAEIARRLVAFRDAGETVDAERGSTVFKARCAACHQLGGEGGRVGPQLDGVGVRGPDRLMEDVLDPNRNVDQAFRASTLALRDGRILTGLVLDDSVEVMVLADSQGQEVRIPKADVEDRAIAPLSPMPSDFAASTTEAEFNDLIAFLLSKREHDPE